MKGRLIWSIFWVLVGVFVIVVSTMFMAPLLRLGVAPNALAVWPVFVGLGVTLIVLTIKMKVGGMLKKFLLLTGASAAGFLIFVLLHNVVSGLLNTEEPVFFVMATIVCPTGFLVGAVGTKVLANKNKQAKYSS